MKVIIGIPAFNEEKNIGSIIAKLKQKYTQIIVCDDGSSDMTSVIASLMGAIKIEQHGTQNHSFSIDEFKQRFKENFEYSF